MAKAMPADFIEVATRLEHHCNDLRKHYRVGDAAIVRWLKESGLRAGIPKGFRACGAATFPPEGFTDDVAVSTLRQLTEKYGGPKVVGRWCRMLRIEPIKVKGKHPVPDDFADNARVMNKWELRKHYGCGDIKVNRWLDLLGISAAKYHPPRRESAPKAYKPRMTVRTGRAAGSSYLPMYDQQHKTKTMFDLAADTLRREHWVVYHATETGKPDPKGAYWRVGNVVCTPDELLARAARYERKAA